LANSFIGLGVAAVVAVRLKRRYDVRFSLVERLKKYTLFEQVWHGFFILAHPIDGFGELRYDNKGSYKSAIIVFLLGVFCLAVKTYLTGFPFRTIPLDEFNTGAFFIQFTSIWLTWVLCNYLISSVYKGEGRFKDVFMGAAYSLYPAILLGIPIAIVSNAMTLSESSVYQFMNWFMILWCAALFFWKTHTLQNYGVGETIINILLTIFTMILLWVLIFIVFGLSSEFISFIYSLYQEVSIR
jgi:hypothetical protein